MTTSSWLARLIEALPTKDFFEYGMQSGNPPPLAATELPLLQWTGEHQIHPLGNSCRPSRQTCRNMLLTEI
jgi:hypothetical protein